MHKITSISLLRFCDLHRINEDFVKELHFFGLIELVSIDNNFYLKDDEICLLEKFVRLHKDLNVNVDAIVTIEHLTELISELKEENRKLAQKLEIYED